MSIGEHRRVSPDEYLALDRAAERKSEYVDGEMFAMAGASEPHVRIVGNCYFSLRTRLPRQCTAYTSDMRTKAGSTYVYPDVTVVCGQPQFDDRELDILLNPLMIIEVLSKSTEAFDRGQKFARYRGIPTLQEYLLIAQDRVHVDQLTRQPDGTWLFKTLTSRTESVVLSSVQCELPLGEIYADIDVPGLMPAN